MFVLTGGVCSEILIPLSTLVGRLDSVTVDSSLGLLLLRILLSFRGVTGSSVWFSVNKVKDLVLRIHVFVVFAKCKAPSCAQRPFCKKKLSCFQ